MLSEELDSKTKRVIDKWSDADYTQSGSNTQWPSIPKVAYNTNRRATGNPNLSWFNHSESFLQALPKPRKALSLASGFGIIERALRKADICQFIDGIEISEAAVEGARQLASEEGLEGLSYRSEDLNVAELPPNTYDVVYAHAALHHIFQLEHVLEQISKTLKPDGVFVIYDYVGPSQMQFSKAHLELADMLLQTIPEPYLKYYQYDGYKKKATRLKLADLNAVDPSEGIRAQEILPLVASRFQIDYLRYVGGTLPLLIFNEIAGNFHHPDPQTDALVDLIIYLDNFLIDAGILPSYHAYVVCRKTDNPMPRQTQDWLISPNIGSLGFESVLGLALNSTSPKLEETRLRAILNEREAALHEAQAQIQNLALRLGEVQQWAREMEQRLLTPSKVRQILNWFK
jgi:SAM-dependent methyltransferase